MAQLLDTVGLIVISLSAGYLGRVYILRRSPATGPGGLTAASALLQKVVFVILMPAMLVITFWGLGLSGGTLVLYPFAGALSHLIAGVASAAASRHIGHGRKQAGAMFNCGTFTNVTAFGGLVAFMFYGETGYALSALFKLFEPLVYFGIGFPLARMYADETASAARLRFDLRALARDPVVMMPLAAILAGAVMNWSGLSRPPLVGQALAPLVTVATAMMLLSVGLNMRIAPFRRYRREVLAILGIKNLLMPASMLAIGLALGYGRLDSGMPLRVLVTMGAMPVAFKSLAAVSLYRLDTDLANLLWLVSTAVFVAVALPLMYLLSAI